MTETLFTGTTGKPVLDFLFKKTPKRNTIFTVLKSMAWKRCSCHTTAPVCTYIVLKVVKITCIYLNVCVCVNWAIVFLDFCVVEWLLWRGAIIKYIALSILSVTEEKIPVDITEYLREQTWGLYGHCMLLEVPWLWYELQS